jgi:osmotically-inducible protein OsmY
MKQLLVLTLAVCLVLPVACTKGTESTQAARESRMTDSDLKSKIEAQLNSDPELRDAHLAISADADQNRVTLSGTVDNEAMRSKALEMARAAHPGLTIDDKIDVKPGEANKSDSYRNQNPNADRDVNRDTVPDVNRKR